MRLTSGLHRAGERRDDSRPATETVVVSGAAPVVDVQNAREVINLPGDEIKELPTSRNVNSLLSLTPGIQSHYRPAQRHVRRAWRLRRRHRRLLQSWCRRLQRRRAGTATDATNLAQGRVLVDGQVINAGGSCRSSDRPAGTPRTSPTPRKSTSRCQVRSVSRRPAAPSINIVPRTGGNRFAGDFNTTYTTDKWFFANNDAYPERSAACSRSRAITTCRLASAARSSETSCGSTRSAATRASTSCRSASTLLAEPE